MRPALLLIDLQNDFLNSACLEPARGQVVEKSARLLNYCRARSIPIIHIWTTADSENRMPHWKHTGKLICLKDTNGHSPPEVLAPVGSETIIHKTFFSSFSSETLTPVLRSLEVDTLLMAGVHLHGCIRATALDGYQLGYTNLIANDAVASDDPLHAAVTRRYLEKRAATFRSVEELCSDLCREREIVGSRQNGEHAHEIVHFSPRQSGHLMWRMPVSSEDEIDNSVREAKEAARLWRFRSIDDRLAVIMRLADLVENSSTELSRQISSEIGKPLSYARGEITYATALLRALPHHIKDGVEVRCDRELGVRYRPLGTVALITPWNNPVAIPLGKIAPALLYGNAVVWKPAPFASKIATAIMDLLQRAEIPEKLVNLVLGYSSTAYRVMEHRSVDAVSITGSSAAGYVAQDVCGRRHIPLQAELGGNNASIIWNDCDVEDAAEKVAEAAFGFSGQRCTANRRAIVDASCYQQFVHCLERATARLSWGDPLDEKTRVGPVISQAKCTELAALITRAQDTAESVLVPHKPDTRLVSEGPYFPPTIVRCDDPQAEIVQEESFGPILVVQRADNWNQSIELCNGVKQGLVASLFSQSENRQSAFLEEAQSGILKLNSGTSNAAAEAPFGGWKASGVGPPEHGSSDREFYTRTQTVYR